MKRISSNFRVTQPWKKLEKQLWSIVKNTHVKKHCQSEDIEKIKRLSFIFIIFATVTSF